MYFWGSQLKGRPTVLLALAWRNPALAACGSVCFAGPGRFLLPEGLISPGKRHKCPLPLLSLPCPSLWQEGFGLQGGVCHMPRRERGRRGGGGGGASNAERSCLRGSLQSGGAPGIHHALRSQQNRAVEGSHRILLQKRGPHLCLSRRRLGRSERRLPEHAGPQQLPLFLGGLS